MAAPDKVSGHGLLPICRVKPVLLAPNRFPRFYRGGHRIDAFRGLPPGAQDEPEDWVGSTATALGSATSGLTRLGGRRTLRAAIEDDPDGFLGADHVERHGADPALLVKLLDAGERLPVHSHPGRAFAREHLATTPGPRGFGKTEAWIIVEAEPGAAVHVGPREPLDRGTLARWVQRQDAGEMLAALREVPVGAGDALLVPAGTLHAIGEGILLVELQEPTDLSVLVEWRRFGISSGAEHLHLGWDLALESVDLQPVALGELLRGASDDPSSRASVLPAAADAYMRAERVRPHGAAVELDASFAVLVVLGGEGRLCTTGGDVARLQVGTTWLVPYGAGASTIEGDVELLRCLPPAPDAPAARW